MTTPMTPANLKCALVKETFQKYPKVALSIQLTPGQKTS